MYKEAIACFSLKSKIYSYIHVPYLSKKKLSTEKKALFTAWKENLWMMFTPKPRSSARIIKDITILINTMHTRQNSTVTY